MAELVKTSTCQRCEGEIELTTTDAHEFGSLAFTEIMEWVHTAYHPYGCVAIPITSIPRSRSPRDVERWLSA